MISALRDTTLSTAIFDVIRVILPYTAEGKAMPSSLAHTVVTQLAATQKLATLMEQELAIHRFDEAGMSVRTMVEREIAAALDQGVTSTVVKFDPDKGRKS
ncbi:MULTISPECIES: hypothetical protein [unclassified Shinella]|uniref:hypothetical protein n=1 Tax=unclassified Shinella TaxID=2643062 RepID=UPI00225C6B5E|nr:MULTISPECIES: hypothetical protein [unclassified Shinella]CAI0339100.1 conserved hypothetical protein [Rhizobiaceae bacterium]CAK7257516.1 protein of unknown function [Shinella sp. WSC3-e]MCO5139028.1 hypothetical protein [Shinella sp.]MCW5711318.1 hypothetical protein [Shinella sp.]MDC7256243.1 hypothetical protein [Shinella sp. YE25]